MRTDIMVNKPHKCSRLCVEKYEKDFKRFVNPLLIPILHGWQRRQTKANPRMRLKIEIYYITPCGVNKKTDTELDHFLRITNSNLTVDMFSFDYCINPDREFEANANFFKIDDVTGGREKKMPISCVNCVDHEKPDDYEYSAYRRPLSGVPLVIAPEKLECCDCTDNCLDRAKCSCWRRTFEATTFTNEKMNTDVGYRNRRLLEKVNNKLFYNLFNFLA
jgi:histone-lysine N-methyltransferase SETDB1